jgi:hypothetical protein
MQTWVGSDPAASKKKEKKISGDSPRTGLYQHHHVKSKVQGVTATSGALQSETTKPGRGNTYSFIDGRHEED